MLCLCLLWLWPQPNKLSHNHTTFITRYPNVVEGTCPFSRRFTHLYHQRQFLTHISQTYGSKCPPNHICISLLYRVGHSSTQVAGWWPWRILRIWPLRTIKTFGSRTTWRQSSKIHWQIDMKFLAFSHMEIYLCNWNLKLSYGGYACAMVMPSKDIFVIYIQTKLYTQSSYLILSIHWSWLDQ